MALKFSGRVDTKASSRVKKKLKDLGEGLSRSKAKELGEIVVSEMLTFIGAGRSPIAGKGKFPKYKNPKRYPGKRKPHSPVNLELTGQFLKSLDSRVIKSGKGYGVEVGYTNDLAADKERGHREGAKGQPKRPTIPKGKQKFARPIQSIISEIMLEHIEEIKKRR